jgi:hypothetical protein
LIGHRHTSGAGLILDDYVRMPRQMRREVTREHARIDVEAGPDADSDYDPDRLAGVEAGRILGSRQNSEARERAQDGEGFPHW